MNPTRAPVLVRGGTSPILEKKLREWRGKWKSFMWVPINWISGNRSGSCSENCGCRIAQVVRCHSENGISILRIILWTPRAAQRISRNSPKGPEWPFHSESVFPEIGVVPRLLIFVASDFRKKLHPREIGFQTGFLSNPDMGLNRSWDLGRGWVHKASVFEVRRFTEWPKPLHWIAFPVKFLSKAFTEYLAMIQCKGGSLHWFLLRRSPFPKLSSSWKWAKRGSQPILTRYGTKTHLPTSRPIWGDWKKHVCATFNWKKGKDPHPQDKIQHLNFTKDPQPLYYKTHPCVIYHKIVCSKAVVGP